MQMKHSKSVSTVVAHKTINRNDYVDVMCSIKALNARVTIIVIGYPPLIRIHATTQARAHFVQQYAYVGQGQGRPYGSTPSNVLP